MIKKQTHPYLKKHHDAYLIWGRTACVVYSGLWLISANWITPFTPIPLPYIALFNPVGLASAGMLFYAWNHNQREKWQKLVKIMALILAFYLLNAEMMRVWHFYIDVEWRLSSLLASIGLQASLSIVWAITGIALMVTGNQFKQRQCWLLGTGLMGIVVVKLFIVELSNTDSVARIVSFIAVGLLLLLVGWFAPLPPEEDR